ncbi:sigma-70 family RNA polymerase sigma factor [Aquabacterium sp. OR-4]|uniref:sigma-70 family RNA polymerase sigma factor n=1 Tax=Aquabacterium sp. OR-4 TaxID=2978127 RepID=UPI0028C7242E|nr:sigma-70 family RNA polymerase sigma factor [Aquabacterium sp. OR-4]MDT7835589.1 sigma-70 family RNA polymerase sigma factor [Aquabacterium sp. OR-4]
MTLAQTDLHAWSERSRTLERHLARSALGDRQAFAELYQLTCGHLLAVMLRIQRDRAIAEDLLQEVYVAVWKAAGSFDAQRAQPLTWLTQIARNRAIDSLRRAQSQPVMESAHRGRDDGDGFAPGDAYDHVPDGRPGPAALLEQASDALQLQRCMTHLSAQQRQTVALTFFDGLSHSEVADHLSQPLGTVKSWARRALLTLRACLDRASGRTAAAQDAAQGA